MGARQSSRRAGKPGSSLGSWARCSFRPKGAGLTPIRLFSPQHGRISIKHLPTHLLPISWIWSPSWPHTSASSVFASTSFGPLAGFVACSCRCLCCRFCSLVSWCLLPSPLRLLWQHLSTNLSAAVRSVDITACSPAPANAGRSVSLIQSCPLLLERHYLPTYWAPTIYSRTRPPLGNDHNSSRPKPSPCVIPSVGGFLGCYNASPVAIATTGIESPSQTLCRLPDTRPSLIFPPTSLVSRQRSSATCQPASPAIGVQRPRWTAATAQTTTYVAHPVLVADQNLSISSKHGS